MERLEPVSIEQDGSDGIPPTRVRDGRSEGRSEERTPGHGLPPLIADRLLRALWQNASDAMRLCDARGTVRLVNDAYCRLVEKPREDLEGQPLCVVEPAARQSHVLHEYQRCFASRVIPPRFETRITMWNGKELYLDHINSFIDLDGQGTLLLSVLRDASERRGAHEERSRLLRERSQLADHLGLVLESTADGILGVDRQGMCTFVNRAAARLLGYSPGELLGRNVHPFFHSPAGAKDDARERCPLCRTFSAGQPCRIESTAIARSDGKSLEAECAAHPILREGSLAGAVVTFADRSEQKQLEAQFHQAQKMEAVGRLAGGVAHDFNNLLTVILGQSDFLLDQLQAGRIESGSAGSSGLVQGLEEIKNAAERAAGLTRQLLLFSRKQIVQPTILNLNSLLANDKMTLRLLGEDIEVLTKLEPQLGNIKADPGQIHQVILNLVINARDAMPQGGKLMIETANVELDEHYARKHLHAQPGAYVLLVVTDSGCGMSAGVLAHVFEPFYTTKAPGKGTGLGLSTVYSIVKQNGGHIEVISAPERGTSFRVYLPRAQEPTQTSVPEAKLITPAPKSKTILVAEDEDMVRRMIRLSLWWNGYTVLEARDGAEALSLAEQHAGPIHLLVTDVLMPGITGNELAARLLRQRPDVQVLYVSGYTDGALDERFHGQPRAAFLQKPFTPDSLARKVAEVLEQGRHSAGR